MITDDDAQMVFCKNFQRPCILWKSLNFVLVLYSVACRLPGKCSKTLQNKFSLGCLSQDGHFNESKVKIIGKLFFIHFVPVPQYCDSVPEQVLLSGGAWNLATSLPRQISAFVYLT